MKLSPLAAVVLLLLPLGACADLSPEAQKDTDQGLDAVQKKDFQLAEQCFQDARQKGGTEVYYDIGLAESKIPGRELRAICWLGAWLAANPKAPAAAAVKTQIDALNTKSREKVRHLIESLQDAADKMPAGEPRDYALRDTITLWAEFGDFDAAKKAIDLIGRELTKYDAYTNLACAYDQLLSEQVQAGDMAGARNSLAEARHAADLIPNDSRKEDAQYYVACAWISLAGGQLKAGDWKGSQESLATAEILNESIRSPGSSNNVLENITAMQVAMARAQLKAGDAAATRESIAAALKSAGFFAGGNAFWPSRMEAFEDIADVQIDAGDMKGAREALASALQSARDEHGFREIAQAQARAGDFDGAKKTAELIVKNASFKLDGLKDIGAGQFKAGDTTGAHETIAEALKTAGLLQDPAARCGALRMIAEAQIDAGDAAGARETLAAALKIIDLIQDANAKGWTLQGIAGSQARAGDVDGAKKTAGLIQNANTKAAALHEITDPAKKSAPFPRMPPFPSERMAMPETVGEESWMMALQTLDLPCFTAHTDFSDIKSIAAEIQAVPINNGIQMVPGNLDDVRSLELVTRWMVNAQKEIGGTLKGTFRILVNP